MLAAVGLLKYWSGYEVSVFILYTLPVALAAWSLGLTAGLVFSLAGAWTWLWADLAAGHVYPQHWILIDRVANILILLVFIAISFHYFRRTLHNREIRVRQLEGLLSVCPTCRRIRGE